MTPGEWKFLRRRLCGIAKKRAKKKGLEFTIKPEDLELPEGTLCPILQVPLVKHKGKLERNTPSLDRVDSTRGYVPGNVRVISWWANYLKEQLTLEQAKALEIGRAHV